MSYAPPTRASKTCPHCGTTYPLLDADGQALPTGELGFYRVLLASGRTRYSAWCKACTIARNHADSAARERADPAVRQRRQTTKRSSFQRAQRAKALANRPPDPLAKS